MSYLRYVRKTTTVAVQNGSDIAIPSGASGVEIQADTGSVRYTCDGTDPDASTGMVFLVASDPKYFVIDDLANLKFTQGSGAGALNFHFVGGRRDL